MMKINMLIGASWLILLTAACQKENGQQLPSRNWQLKWSSEFEGAAGAALDTTQWTFDLGRGDNGWGNQEWQYYTRRPENVALDGNGNLVITARKEDYEGAAYTSARIKTKGLFAQRYGRFEARMITPYGQGLWPAFWLLGDNIDAVGWPQCGEIDIMEVRGQLPHIMECALHGPGYSGANSITGRRTLVNSRYDTDYHLFAVEWSEDKLDFFVDDYLYRRIEKSEVEQKGKWAFDQPFFLLLNVAVGGNYVGAPQTDTPFPQKMVIDYVRVYQ